MPMRSHLALRPKFLTCSICNELVELETAKIDEDGKPTHEECYVQKVILKRSIRPPPEAGKDPPVSQSIVTFLDSKNAHTVTNCCPVCGSPLEYRQCTFFYAGRTWEFPLAICLDCDPAVPSCDA